MSSQCRARFVPVNIPYEEHFCEKVAGHSDGLHEDSTWLWKDEEMSVKPPDYAFLAEARKLLKEGLYGDSIDWLMRVKDFLKRSDPDGK